MNRISILSFIVVLVGVSCLIATTAQSQVGPPKAYVNLQPTTPGTSQSGHANVSGILRASQLVGGGAGLTNVNAAQVYMAKLRVGALVRKEVVELKAKLI